MLFLELFVPRGAFSAEQLRELAGRLTLRQLVVHADAVRDVVDADEVSSVNPGVMDFADTVNHVVVHEIGTWVVGGQFIGHAGPPRYLARAYVPGPWRKAMTAFLIASITHAISQASHERIGATRNRASRFTSSACRKAGTGSLAALRASRPCWT
jgi:hypothetical protein